MMKIRNRFLLLLVVLLTNLPLLANAEHIYVYAHDTISFLKQATEIDSIVVQNNTMSILNANKDVLFSAPLSEVDSITFNYEKPKADLLDVVFNVDGTATDASPMAMPVQAININGLTAYPYARNNYTAMHFDNPKGSTPTSFYKVDYSGNQDFKDKLSDGHSFEAVFMMTETPYSTSSSEAKFFGGHQAAGTGFSVCRSKISFFPNITQTGNSNYINVVADIVPQENVFYHVIGVWNKEEGKAYIYVNGNLESCVPAVGNLKLAAAAAQWFGIGCDANTANGEMGWNGDVVMARIYDKPLTANDAKVLWNSYKEEQAENPNLVDNVDYFSGLPVVRGQGYEFVGQGFQESDIIKLVPFTGKGTVLARKISLTGDTAQIKLPTTIKSGVYSVYLIRGSQSQLMGLDSIVVVNKLPKAFEANFHRGLWNTPGSAQNSRTSLKNAIAHHAYSSELDIWLTTDDSIMINHDASLNGVTIQNSSYEQVKDLTLVNGEKIPMLRDMLEILAQSEGTILVIETKSHSTTARSIEASRKAMALVKAMGLQDKVQYCSFNLPVCKDQHALDSTATIFYINGDLSPQQLHEYGLHMDYTPTVYKNHPTWISEARNLGITSISWTLNSKAAIIDSANMEADVLASDYPWWSQKIREYYVRHQEK